MLKYFSQCFEGEVEENRNPDWVSRWKSDFLFQALNDYQMAVGRRRPLSGALFWAQCVTRLIVCIPLSTHCTFAARFAYNEDEYPEENKEWRVINQAVAGDQPSSAASLSMYILPRFPCVSRALPFHHPHHSPTNTRIWGGGHHIKNVIRNIF